MEYIDGNVYKFVIRSKQEINDAGFSTNPRDSNYVRFGWNGEMDGLSGREFEFTCHKCNDYYLFKSNSIPFSWSIEMLKSSNPLVDILSKL